MDEAERRARTRFFTIGLVRLSGAVMLAFAVAILLGRFPDMPEVAGYVLLALGAVEIVVLPQLLVARWKSPPDP